jgi:hypothetical protein
MRHAIALSVTLFLLGGAAGAQEGLKQTENFIKKGEQTMKAIGDARQQLERTLATYNAIIDGKTPDSKASYKDLGKAVKDTEDRAADVTKRKEEMDAEAEKLFASWKESLAGIGTPELAKRSEERLQGTRDRHAKIAAAGQQARSEYDGFLLGLKDQITYLGHDLNPSAIASLKPDAAKLNERAKKMFERLDSTVAAANSSLDAMRSQ